MVPTYNCHASKSHLHRDNVKPEGPGFVATLGLSSFDLQKNRSSPPGASSGAQALPKQLHLQRTPRTRLTRKHGSNKLGCSPRSLTRHQSSGDIHREYPANQSGQRHSSTLGRCSHRPAYIKMIFRSGGPAHASSAPGNDW